MSDKKSVKDIPAKVSKATMEDAAFRLIHIQASHTQEESSSKENENLIKNDDIESEKALNSDNNPELPEGLTHKPSDTVLNSSDSIVEDTSSTNTQ